MTLKRFCLNQSIGLIHLMGAQYEKLRDLQIINLLI